MALQFRALRLRVRALTAGVIDDAAVESVLLTKMTELWDSWQWSFTQAQDVLATEGPKTAGTATLTAPTQVTGAATAFSAADVGRELIVGNENSRYIVSAVDVPLQRLTLTSPYAGATFTNAPYRLQRSIYVLAADFNSSFSPVYWRPIVETSLPMFDRYDGRRSFSSTFPTRFRYAGVSSAGVQQVEIAPVPSAPVGIYYTYRRTLPPMADDTPILLREDMVAYLAASDALALKAIEAAEKLPNAATLYAAQSEKYQALGQNARMEAQYADLRLASPAGQVRDAIGAYDYSDDVLVSHDLFSPI